MIYNEIKLYIIIIYELIHEQIIQIYFLFTVSIQFRKFHTCIKSFIIFSISDTLCYIFIYIIYLI